MGVSEEEWVKAAMRDDTMVVELLVRLQGAAPPPLPPTLPLEWNVRQRRSRPVTIKLAQSQGASPTTPLSWSGATSEDSSRPNIQNIYTVTRSKINGDSENAIPKRSRKKKSLAELKDEENSLLKEKRTLKKGIAVLRINLEKQRAKHEKLKRITVELQPLTNRKTTSAMEQAISNHFPPETTVDHPTPPDSDATMSSTFVLPDLNMPFVEPCPGVS